LDDFDLAILRELQKEPTVKMADLAERVGLSQTPCWRRVKALEESGVIAGRAVLIDGSKLGLRVNAFAHLRLSRHDEETLETLERELRARPEIVECFLMGGDYDYQLRIIVGDLEEYERYLKKVLVHLPGVASVNSSFSLKTIKATTALPI
jgi:Lrp/AsnC family transcriptional regulator